jgi:topoisomerase-4 subunit B
MNGVGLKAANALSSRFTVQSFRNGETLALEYERGILQTPDFTPKPTTERNGTLVSFIHDDTLFKSGKNGFAITERGIYCRPMGEAALFYTWDKFSNLPKPELG